MTAKQFGTIKGQTILYEDDNVSEGIVITVSEETQNKLLEMSSEELKQFVKHNVKQ